MFHVSRKKEKTSILSEVLNTGHLEWKLVTESLQFRDKTKKKSGTQFWFINIQCRTKNRCDYRKKKVLVEWRGRWRRTWGETQAAAMKAGRKNLDSSSNHMTHCISHLLKRKDRHTSPLCRPPSIHLAKSAQYYPEKNRQTKKQNKTTVVL